MPALPLSTVAFFFRSGKKVRTTLERKHCANRRKASILILSNLEQTHNPRKPLCRSFFHQKSKIGNYQKMV
jgi:hypothetical protein